jgi:hypothetical protein
MFCCDRFEVTQYGSLSPLALVVQEAIESQFEAQRFEEPKTIKSFSNQQVAVFKDGTGYVVSKTVTFHVVCCFDDFLQKLTTFFLFCLAHIDESKNVYFSRIC